MLSIIAKNPSDTWKLSIKKIIELPNSTIESLWKNSPAVITVEDINNNLYDENFPMTEKQINDINNHLVYGTNKEDVIHEWTLLYRKRLVNEKYNQIQNIIDYLNNKPSGKRAQMSIWDPVIDLNSKIGPCLQIIFCQIIDDKLELHAHLRACDAYGKLLMNINEFIALQKYIAEQLKIPCGKYMQFIDSLHFNIKDKEKIEELVKIL